MFVVNGETWRIRIVDKRDPILMRSDGEYTLGVTDDLTKTIYIARGMNCKKLKKVLIHECVHALMFSMDIYMDVYQEECLCNAISDYGQYLLNICYDFLDGVC